MGVDPEYPPFSYLGDDGKFTGFDVEVAQAVCDELGWDLKVFGVNWDQKLVQLDSNECDCIWSGMTILDSMKDAGYVCLLYTSHGDGADRAQILRHVLADAAVAARRAADEHAVAVFERDAQPVDLRLDAVFRVRERSGHALEEFLHLATVEHILQALERHRVLHRCKLRQRRAAHALRGGIGCDLLRVCLLYTSC